ncbi:MAG: MlaD family protein [Gemmatimonadota bacterium]|nr:MlaD family protein [Gemmatimonadota bacterium]
MISREKQLFLGAVIFLAIAIAVLGATWLSENYAGAAGGYQLHVFFESVPGLQPGDPVFIRGVWAGKVLDIGLTHGLPLVSIGFAEFRNLPRDSKVLLQAEGLLGGKMIDVQVGTESDRVYADHDTLRGSSEGGIEEMAEHAGVLAQRLEAVLADRNLDHFEALLANMDSTAALLKQAVAENRVTLKALLDTAALAARDARDILGENRPEVRRVVGNMRRATERLDGMARTFETALESFERSLSDLNEVGGKLRRGEGTLGRLVHDETLYLDMRRTLASVDSLIEDIKEDPKRYLNVDVSLF